MDLNRLKTQKWIRWAVIGSIAVCLMIALFCVFSGGEEPDTPDTPQEEPSITQIIQGVLSLKDDLKAIVNDIKNNDLESASARTDTVSGNIKALGRIVSDTRQFLGEYFFLREQLDNVQNILDLAQMGLDNILQPLITQIQTHPVSQLHVEDGINTKWIGSYLDFAEAVMADVEAFLILANATDFSLIDSDGKIAGYLVQANELLEIYNSYKPELQVLRSVLGVDEDRLYLIAAQNSSEIRASGGFPGSMGTVRITDGVLTMGDFKSVYDVLATYTPKEANVTSQENKLFHNGLKAPRDADYCPDFERVAYIWALGYEDEQGDQVDGVISLTPCIVQRLLTVMGEEIELFDGTILNSDNATRVLQYDIYFKYFGKEKIKNNYEIADELFADAAKKLMELLMDNLELSYLPEYLSVVQESFADRTMMLWMCEEEQQAAVKELGWHGGLNEDPENPQAGIYYSCTIASKMGWFLIMDTEIGERSLNEDGSYTYPITVTFSNDITREEIEAASGYITGGWSGTIVGSAYFFAPAGGTVTDFAASNNQTVKTDVYNDLQLGYMLRFRIKPDQEIKVTYYVTTAPGVETPLTISKTPTVQEYHE